MRGYSIVALENIKNKLNMGGVMRAARVYDAAAVVIAGRRFKDQCSDTTRAWRHMPVFEVQDFWQVIPHGCVPVAVEITPQSRSLVNYTHPERAIYIFGPEDGSLSEQVINRCRDVIKIPTSFCMNLAATVNVVLYDRLSKKREKGTISDVL